MPSVRPKTAEATSNKIHSGIMQPELQRALSKKKSCLVRLNHLPHFMCVFHLSVYYMIALSIGLYIIYAFPTFISKI